MALKACYCDLQLLLCQSDNNSEAAHGQWYLVQAAAAKQKMVNKQWKDQCCHPMDINRTAAIRSILFWFGLLHQVGWGRRRNITFFSHGYEFHPVATETLRVSTSVHD